MKRNCVICRNTGPCFGRTAEGHCLILASSYRPEKCPFQKKDREVTKGRRHPFVSQGVIDYEGKV